MNLSRNNSFSSEDKIIFQQLQSFADAVNKYIADTDNVFIDISQLLPKMETQIDNNLLEATELIDFIFSADKENKQFGVTHEIEEFHKELEKAVSEIKKSEAVGMEVIEDLNTSIRMVTELIGKMTDVLDFSENLKVFAINSITNSQKAGNRGSGYKIISSEFIKISEKISIWTEKLNFESEKIKELTAAISTEINAHKDISNSHFNQIQNDSGEILSNTEKIVKNFSIILNDILKRINEVKSPTYEIMIKIQHQDIIKQQLVHVTETIETILLVVKHYMDLSSGEVHDEVDDDDSINGVYALIDFLVSLTGKQMSRISGDLERMLDDLDVYFYQMTDSIKDIDQDKKHFSDIIFSEDDNPAPIISLLFDSPKKLIAAFAKNYRGILEQKSHLLREFSSIEVRIRNEKNIAADFPAISNELSNLIMLSKIEQARYKLHLSDKDSFMSSKFSDVTLKNLLKLIDDIDSAHISIKQDILETRVIFDKHQEDFHDIERCLADSIKILDNTEQLFIDNFQNVMDLTTELKKQIEDYIGMFGSLRSSNQIINEKIAICEDIHYILLDRCEKLGSSIDISDYHFKDFVFNEIVSKYTVDDERSTVIESSDVFYDIEKSSDDSITLF